MLGQPVTLQIPEVIGVHLTGELQEGVTATDLTLRVTEMLRKEKVVDKFVEFLAMEQGPYLLLTEQQSPIWLLNMELRSAFSLAMKKRLIIFA